MEDLSLPVTLKNRNQVRLPQTKKRYVANPRPQTREPERALLVPGSSGFLPLSGCFTCDFWRTHNVYPFFCVCSETLLLFCLRMPSSSFFIVMFIPLLLQLQETPPGPAFPSLSLHSFTEQLRCAMKSKLSLSGEGPWRRQHVQ